MTDHPPQRFTLTLHSTDPGSDAAVVLGGITQPDGVTATPTEIRIRFTRADIESNIWADR